jgi:hypothetical protein
VTVSDERDYAVSFVVAETDFRLRPHPFPEPFLTDFPIR